MLEIRIGDFRAEAHSPEGARYTSRLLLVHGLWGTASLWRRFGSFLAHRGWEVIAPDLRGRPASRPAAIERVALDDYVGDVIELVRSEAATSPSGGDAAPPVVVGHDLGGLVALAVATRAPCRAVIALAPPLSGALTDRYRRWLRRARGGWLRRKLPPPDDPGETLEPERLQVDSAAVARSLLRGELSIDPPSIPALIVGGTRDALVDPRRLETAARALGCSFAERGAAHWGLEDKGFERQVDLLHRWLVQAVGPDLLRLTGYEDLEENESEP